MTNQQLANRTANIQLEKAKARGMVHATRVAYIQREKAKAMEDPNLHETIKDTIVNTIAENSKWDTHQHYREILDDIIFDLQQYAETLPTAGELLAANKL